MISQNASLSRLKLCSKNNAKKWFSFSVRRELLRHLSPASLRSVYARAKANSIQFGISSFTSSSRSPHANQSSVSPSLEFFPLSDSENHERKKGFFPSRRRARQKNVIIACKSVFFLLWFSFDDQSDEIRFALFVSLALSLIERIKKKKNFNDNSELERRKDERKTSLKTLTRSEHAFRWMQCTKTDDECEFFAAENRQSLEWQKRRTKWRKSKKKKKNSSGDRSEWIDATNTCDWETKSAWKRWKKSSLRLFCSLFSALLLFHVRSASRVLCSILQALLLIYISSSACVFRKTKGQK